MKKITKDCNDESKNDDIVYVDASDFDHDVINAKKLTESQDYRDIQNDIQDKLAKLLLRNTNNNVDHSKHIHDKAQKNKNYKSTNDLLNECVTCGANTQRIYTDCESVKRIKIVLLAYKRLMMNSKLWRKISLQHIVSFDNIYELTQINDDFIHIRDHVAEYNQLLKQFKNEFECNNSECDGIRRRIICEYPESMRLEETVFQQEIDKIHSYLLHSFDINSYPDDTTTQQQSNMTGKRYIGEKEDEMWFKFKTHANDDEIENDENIYRQLVEKMKIFRWQQPHGFTNKQHRGLIHLKPKYKDVKEEALNNKYYALSKDNWNQTLRKSNVFFKSFARHRIKTVYTGKYDDRITGTYEEWKTGATIDMKEIVTLKLYTDFDKLQFELKKCFRYDTRCDIFTLQDFNPKLTKEQATINMIDPNQKNKILLEQRLSIFYWWRMMLLKVLNKYGRHLSQQQIQLYHGVDSKMILNNGTRHNLAFCGPISTSASYHVARTFATAKGMILKITSQYPRLNHCNAFDASLISDYPEEKEWLIGFIYLRIIKVLTRPLNKNWKTIQDCDNPCNNKHVALSSQIRAIFFAVHLFRQQVFSMSVHSEYYLCAFLYLQCYWNDSEERYDNGHIKAYRFADLLHKTVSNRNEITQTSDYNRQHKILNILWRKFDNFRKYPNAKQVVKIDEISDNLKPYFMNFNGLDIHKKEKYVISLAKIIRIFPNVREIVFVNSYILDNDVLKQLVTYVTTNPKCKLKTIKFLYYDYQTSENNRIDYPTNSQIFCPPQQLDKQFIHLLKEKEWEIKHAKLGISGYEIKIFSKNPSVSNYIVPVEQNPYDEKKLFIDEEEKKSEIITDGLDDGKYEIKEVNIASNNYKITAEIPDAYQQYYHAYKISPKLSNEILPHAIKQQIPNLYHHIIKSIPLQENNEFNTQYGRIKIFNYGFHHKISNLILYLVATPYNKNNYQWQIIKKLFTENDIKTQYGIKALPKFWRCDPKWQNYSQAQQHVKMFLNNQQNFCKMKKTTKWTKITIYNKKENIKRMTLSLRNHKFFRNLQQKSDDIIPIIMPDKNSKSYNIEFVQISKVGNDLEIGISYIYQNNIVKVQGIHLDKWFIQSQHQLLTLPDHKCQCLQNFTMNSMVDHLFIGIPDGHKNNLDRLKHKYTKQSELLSHVIKYMKTMQLHPVSITANNLQILVQEISKKIHVIKNDKNADCSLDTSVLLDLEEKHNDNFELSPHDIVDINNFYFQQTLNPNPQPIIPHPIHKQMHSIGMLDISSLLDENKACNKIIQNVIDINNFYYKQILNPHRQPIIIHPMHTRTHYIQRM